MPTVTPLLQFTQFGCARGGAGDNRVLFSAIDYQLNAGDVVQIEGPNGSGKTTFLRALTRLFPDHEGDILWRGESLVDASYGFLSQLLFIGHLSGIKKALTPRENLSFLANLNGHYTLEEIDHALVQVGLYGYEDMLGYQLSAGQNRRVALARLYLSNALVWVLDEPYTALDVQGIDKLERLFETHTQQGGCVILTSHQPPKISGLKCLSLLDYPPIAELVDNNEREYG
ncbi:MAG: heme exporter protein A [Kiritimatiellia bacterium]|jgi:heme exporter protein A